MKLQKQRKLFSIEREIPKVMKVMVGYPNIMEKLNLKLSLQMFKGGNQKYIRIIGKRLKKTIIL